MKPELLNNKDFWSGMMFIGTGAAAIFVASDYRLGTTLRMGPGYYPCVLGGILVAIGLYVMINGLLKHQKIEGNWSARALLLVPCSMVLFGLLLEYAGFIPALIPLIIGSAAAGKEFKLLEVLLLALFLTLLSVAIFIWGLGLPYSLIKTY